MDSKKKCRKCKLEKYVNEFDPDRMGRYGVASTCKLCKKEKLLSSQPKELKRTEVKKVWKKKIDRLKNRGSETKLHLQKFKETNRVCIVCEKPIKFFDPSCFAHVIPKSRFDDNRMDPRNIAVVHGIWEVEDEATGKTYDCHGKLDRCISGYKEFIEEKLKDPTTTQWDIDEIIKSLVFDYRKKQ